MEDRITPSGHVKIEIIRASGIKLIDQEGPNTIHLDLKHKMASACVVATTAFGVMNSAFDNDDFSTPTNGESGIYITDTSAVKYQMVTSLDASSAYSFTCKGVARASQSYTIDTANLGHGYSTGNGDFDVQFSSYDFSPNITLADGDQLNVTWQVTIANS